MSIEHATARPYAEAAFEYARERKLLDVWSKQLHIAAEIISSKQIAALLADPRVGERIVAQSMIEIFNTVVDESMKNFIKLLAQNTRLQDLPEIATLFDDYRAAYEKTVHVHVTSAFPVSKNEQDSLQRALEIRLQREVVIQTEEDKSLIGGAVVRAGDLVIDGSIRGKLSRLIQELTA